LYEGKGERVKGEGAAIEGEKERRRKEEGKKPVM
jgi:hypothetical protein